MRHHHTTACPYSEGQHTGAASTRRAACTGTGKCSGSQRKTALEQRTIRRHAWYEFRGQCQRPDGDRGVQGGTAPPGAHRAADLRGARAGLDQRAGLAAVRPEWRGGHARHATTCPGRARRAPGAAGRLRPAMGLRRDLAGPAQDGDRPALAGDRAHRGHLPAMGAAPGELGRDKLVVSPDAGRGLGGVDSGRDRHLDARCGARHLVPAGRGGQRGLGPGGLGVR